MFIFHAPLIIMSRKYFFDFRSSQLATLRYTILDSRFTPENAISEGRPPLCNSSSETGSLPSEVRIENDSDRKFLSPKFLKHFLETTFLYVSCYPYHYEPKIFFRFFLEIFFSDKKFSKSKYFKSFSGNYSCSCFMLH